MEKAFFRFPSILTCLCLCTFLLSSVTILAQEDSIQSDFKKNQFGFATGIGFSGIRDHSFYNTGKMLGFPNFSLVYQRNLLPQFAIRSGIGYVRKGDHFKYYTGFGSQMTITRVRLNYIEIPILIMLQSPTKFSPYINAGVSYGIALGESQITTNDQLNNPDAFRKSIDKEIYNRLDNALVASSGFKINGKKSDFFIELQYSYSLTDVFYNDSRNNVISCHLGFLFGK